MIKKFEDNLVENLQKEIKIIDNLYRNIENKNFTIDRADDKDYEELLNNLYFIQNSIKFCK